MSDPSARFWDRIATRYAARPVMDEAAYAQTLERVRAHLKPSDRVLEVGCGTGTTALKLAPAVAAYRATDFSGGMIDIARAKPAETAVDFAQAGLDDAGGTGPYDAVLAFNLLHLLPDLDAALAQLRAHIRPGGLLISKSFVAPDAGLPWKLRLMMLALPVLQLLGKAPPVTVRKLSEHEAAFARAGFEILERGNYPEMPPSRFLVARKSG